MHFNWSAFWLACGVALGALLVVEGVRDFRRAMKWETGLAPIPSRLGAPVFYLIMAVVVVFLVLLFLLLVLTGKPGKNDLDDDHLFTMPGR